MVCFLIALVFFFFKVDYISSALESLLFLALVLRRWFVVTSPPLKATVPPKLVGQGTIVVGMAGDIILRRVALRINLKKVCQYKLFH